ncbi:MAG: alpha-D-ribose 1-methylphosphonate 5-triphosphate diphosphatase [Hyphomicrobiales bacterium]
MTIRIAGAKVILKDDVVETDVVIDGDIIVDVGGSSAAEHMIDGRGFLLAPGMIDIHGDAFERQLMPRPNVFFPIDAALLETDRQLATNGISTAYHALTLSWEPGLRSVERGQAFLDALTAQQSRFTIENRVQLRWETFAFEALDLIERALDMPLSPSIAFNDHTSMTLRSQDVKIQERLFEHNPDFKVTDLDDPNLRQRATRDGLRAGLSTDEYLELLKNVWQRRADVPDMISKVSKMGKITQVPMLSHDDTQDETRNFYRAMGASISEFPMQVSVARAAREAGDVTVFGSPNVVRGGSQIGSPSAADMVEDGLCDILASDYFYPAMLAAVARLVKEKRGDLAALWSLVSSGPANASGLNDRGEIAVGKRADLILIDWPQNQPPAVKLNLSQGNTAYSAL